MYHLEFLIGALNRKITGNNSVQIATAGEMMKKAVQGTSETPLSITPEGEEENKTVALSDALKAKTEAAEASAKIDYAKALDLLEPLLAILPSVETYKRAGVQQK